MTYALDENLEFGEFDNIVERVFFVIDNQELDLELHENPLKKLPCSSFTGSSSRSSMEVFERRVLRNYGGKVSYDLGS